MSYNELLTYLSAPGLGWSLLLISMIGDLAAPFFLGLFVRRYSHKYMLMSELGHPTSAVHGVYNKWLVLCGILILCGSPQIASSYARVDAGVAGTATICLIIYAVGGCIIAGFAPTAIDGKPETVREKIHAVGASIGFMALMIVPLLSGILFLESAQPVAGTVSICCFGAAAASFVLFVLADRERFAGTPISWIGLWQRLSMLFAYLPIIIMAAMRP